MNVHIKTILLVAGTILGITVAVAVANPPANDPHAPADHTPPAKAPATGKPAAKPAAKPPAKPIISLPKYDDTKGTPKATGKSDAHADPHADPHADAATPDAHAPAAHADSNEHAAPSGNAAEQAFVMLREGNERWVEGKSTAPHTEPSRLEETATNGQKPQVTIITCSDSRIPVERVFDQGVGDLFVVRGAGNRAGGSETGTVEYGVEHLKTPLLLVMGHTKCGAVAAAASKAKLHGKVAELVAGIEPAVERARRFNPNADEKEIAALAVRENVWQTVFDLYRNSPVVREMVSKGEIKVIGGIYDIATGKVEFMGEHPWQQELITAMNQRDIESGTATATVSEDPHH
jgi:carbonic anhydrase